MDDIIETENLPALQEVLQESYQEPQAAPIEPEILPPIPEIDEDCQFTDVGNALRFVTYFAMLAFFSHELKNWFINVKTHWKLDTTKTLTSYAIEAVRRMRSVELATHPKPNDLIKWIQKSLQLSKIKSLIVLAADLIPCPAELDSHPFYLNTQSCTIDLRTGELLKHDPAHYITKLAPVVYDPYALCPKWLELLNTAFSGDQKLIDYFQKVMGYTLTGDVSEKRLFVFWGPGGNNGKSLINNVWRGVLGPDYCVNIASDSLTSGRHHVRSDIGRLETKDRFATSSETDTAFKFNESLIKEMTGDDVITARRLSSNEREFRIQFKLFLSTNHIPEFNLSDAAMADRVVIIPFLNSIPSEKRIKNYATTLVNEEGPGILAWAVKGAVRWHQDGGLGVIPVDQKDLRKINPVPTVKEFIEKHCIQDPVAKTLTSALYESFKSYHANSGCKHEPISLTTFGIMLNSLGFNIEHRVEGNFRLGIALKPVTPEVSEQAEG